MTMETALVSVVMPAYNMERFIEPAIRSVQAQTYGNWELLVIDDCSCDRTCEIVAELAAQDARIRLIRNEGNMGVAKTRNRGFELAQGKYVALLDSDDLWRPEKLERQLHLAQASGADIVYCSYSMVDEAGQPVCNDFLVPEATDFDASAIRMVISCSTALLAETVFKKYRFHAGYYHEDLVFWLQILNDGLTARGVKDILADYRICSGTRAANKIRSARNRWTVYRHYFGFSLGKSAGLLARYAFYGVAKYRRKNKR